MQNYQQFVITMKCVQRLSVIYLCRVRTEPGKVWKVLEFNVEIFRP